jgi:hypothetical protein
MIFVFSHNPEKIEMIFLISAEYSLKTNPEEINMTTTQTFNVGEMNSLLKNYTDALLTLHGIPLTDYSHKVSGEAMVAEFTARKTLATAMWQLHEQAQAQADEIAELKKQIPKHRCPQDESLIGDANFTYYAAIDDKNEHDLTIWKVPRHLSDIKTPNTDYHGAVEQAFADEKFGERHERLDYFIVREMKMADLTKRKIQVEE